MIDGMPAVILQPDLIKNSASSLRTKLSKMHQFKKQAKSMKFNENHCKYIAKPTAQVFERCTADNIYEDTPERMS